MPASLLRALLAALYLRMNKSKAAYNRIIQRRKNNLILFIGLALFAWFSYYFYFRDGAADEYPMWYFIAMFVVYLSTAFIYYTPNDRGRAAANKSYPACPQCSENLDPSGIIGTKVPERCKHCGLNIKI